MESTKYFGEFAALAASMVWAFSMVMFKRYGTGIPSLKLNFFKNFFATSALLITCLFIPTIWPTQGHIWFWVTVSGVVGLAIGDSAGFFSMKVLGAQAAAALQLLIPPMTLLIALLAIRETLTLLQQVGMLITVFSVGGALYFKGSTPTFKNLEKKVLMKGIAAGLFASLCQAVGIVAARHVMNEVEVLPATTIRLGSSVIALVFMAQYFRWRQTGPAEDGEVTIPITYKMMAGIVVASLVGSYLGLMLLSASARFTKAGITASLSATTPIWIIPVSYLLVGERTSWLSVGCTVFALVGVVLMFF